ncbi:DUF3305 domain-containing protein [Azospirillum sp. sgz301742]
MQISESRSVGVVVERRQTGNIWQPERWSAVALLPGRPDVAPWTVLDEGEGWTRRYAGAAEVALFASETDNYKHNLDGPQPAIFVILRRDGSGESGLRLLGVTVDPGEIDAHSDAGDDLIEALPLPPDLAAWMRDFVERYHVERPFHKRKRDRADPEALARRSHLENDHG